jgi:hypothetical protein
MAITFDGYGCPKCGAALDGLGPGDFCPGCRIKLDTHDVFSKAEKPGVFLKWALRLAAVGCFLLAAGVFIAPRSRPTYSIAPAPPSISPPSSAAAAWPC